MLNPVNQTNGLENRQYPAFDRSWVSHAGCLALLWVWIGFNYYDTVKSIVSTWSRSETFAHGFFVFPIALWLVWRKRFELLAVRPAFNWPSVVAIVLSAGGWILGEYLNANVIRHFSLIGMLISSVVAAIGPHAARRIMFPLFFLLFAVPFGEFLIPTLMKWTADFTVTALRFSGIPVHQEGMQFVIPSGSWSVIEACSGVRYLIASISIGSLFAYLSFTSWKRRLLFVLFSLFVPVLANWVRAYLIVLLGHLTDNRLAAGFDHLIYGWVFFGVVMSILFFFGARWSQGSADPSSAALLQDSARASSDGLFAGTMVAMLVISVRYAAGI